MITAKTPQKNISEEESKRVHLNESKGETLASTLAEIRLKQKESLVEQNARQRGLPYVNLNQFPISTEALQLLDRAYCEEHKVVAFLLQGEQLRLGAVNPDDPVLMPKMKEMEQLHRVQAALYMISEDGLRVALKRYDAIPKFKPPHDEGIEISGDVLKKQQEKIGSIKQMNEALARAQVTEVMSLIIAAGMKANASDIHIETEADDIKVRLRIDGVLHDIGILPTETWPRIISRIKLVANLKINISNIPQDGRFTIFIDDDKIEVRVSTVPTAYGESVVMRLLRFSAEALSFDSLGLMGYTYNVLKEQSERPNGMIISTGPTGSGKTTTLYAILNRLNSTDTKILTLEDPIEYKIKGINQTQVNVANGLDFAKGLRSLMRQDPDIIMVGEIRDLETADTAINAALTGHLMLSTMHTNSAAGTIPRFLAMGSKSFLLAPAINAMIGQRLVRRLCTACKQPEQLHEKIKEKVLEGLQSLLERTDLGSDVDVKQPDKFVFYSAPGCDQCNGLGYKGRIGIYEILTMNKDLENLILSGKVSEYEIERIAVEHGMITMFQDGILKALQGITSVSEVMRQTE